MTMPIEYLFAILGIIGCACAWILSKLDKIIDAISDLRENRVSHAVCAQRRETCPCIKDLERLDKEMSTETKMHILREK